MTAATGPWDDALAQLRDRDPTWADTAGTQPAAKTALQACNLGVPILAEELARSSARGT